VPGPNNSQLMPQPFDPKHFVDALDKVLSCLPEDPSSIQSLSAHKLRALRVKTESALDRLNAFFRGLDPIRQPPYVFDPSDPKVIGELIAKTVRAQPRVRLGDIPRFYGSGVYSIYYAGDFVAYKPIKGTENPIYVGKADPQDMHARTVEAQGIGLWRRIGEHRKSISAAQNLKIEDFTARYLVVKSAWQETAEDFLINSFHPVWNNETGVCYGFGKHGDDPKTRANERSPWDTLHPGRAWAGEGNVPNEKTAEQIIGDIADHFKLHPPVASLNAEAHSPE
jgi:hypothetical protein